MYVLYEYIEGNDLEKLINEGPLDEKIVQHLCCRISHAIEEMWALRVVHRDIKPSNILVDKNNLVFLIDLGIAKHLDKEKVTDTGYILGTQGYMSPEQFAGWKLSLKSDIFSLGIVAYEAVTGVHPFECNQLLIGNIPHCPIQNIRPVNSKLISVINAMLSLHPVLRPSGKWVEEKLQS